MKRVLFHGTSKQLLEFNQDSIGIGGDPNSALGIHTTDCPRYAADYAARSEALSEGERGRVYVVLYPESKTHYMHSMEDFYGCEDDETNNHQHFAELRKEFLKEEVSIVELDAGEDNITTLLEPEKAKITFELTIEQAEQLGEYFETNDISWEQGEERIAAILSMLKMDNIKMYHGSCTGLWDAKRNEGYIYFTKDPKHAEWHGKEKAKDWSEKSRGIILEIEITPHMLLNYDFHPDNDLSDDLYGYKNWKQSYDEIGTFYIVGDTTNLSYTAVSILKDKHIENEDIEFKKSNNTEIKNDFSWCVD